MVAKYVDKRRAVQVAQARVVLLEERQRDAQSSARARTWPSWEPTSAAMRKFSLLLQDHDSTREQRNEAQDELYAADRAYHLACVAYKRAEVRDEQLDLELIDARHALHLAERAVDDAFWGAR